MFCLHTDIDECKERTACQCPECSCKDTWGSYDCTCSGDLLYIRDHDTCISESINPSLLNSNDYVLDLQKLLVLMSSLWSSAGKTARETRSSWAAVWVILIGLAMAGGGAYLVYKYRLRVSLLDYNVFADLTYLCLLWIVDSPCAASIRLPHWLLSQDHFLCIVLFCITLCL